MARIETLKSKQWFSPLVIVLYVGAIVLANALITMYGQVALPFVAFALIPFDLIVRDLLQDKWQDATKFQLRLRMGSLIVIGGCISILTGTGSARVNLASFLAFTIAGSIDALTYQWMIRYGRIFRINGATLTAAITDSIIFVFIAFSEVNWKLIGLQIGMKVTGGFVWSLLLFKFFRRQEWSPLAYMPGAVTDAVEILVEITCPNCNHSFERAARYVMVSSEDPDVPYFSSDGKMIASFSKKEIQMQVDSHNKICGGSVRLRVLDLKIQDHCWEVVSDPDEVMHHVRWSKPNKRGEYFMCAHYPEKWRAQSQADEWNRISKSPYEFHFFTLGGE